MAGKLLRGNTEGEGAIFAAGRSGSPDVPRGRGRPSAGEGDRLSRTGAITTPQDSCQNQTMCKHTQQLTSQGLVEKNVEKDNQTLVKERIFIQLQTQSVDVTSEFLRTWRIQSLSLDLSALSFPLCSFNLVTEHLLSAGNPGVRLAASQGWPGELRFSAREIRLETVSYANP